MIFNSSYIKELINIFNTQGSSSSKTVENDILAALNDYRKILKEDEESVKEDEDNPVETIEYWEVYNNGVDGRAPKHVVGNFRSKEDAEKVALDYDAFQQSVLHLYKSVKGFQKDKQIRPVLDKLSKEEIDLLKEHFKDTE